MCGYIGSLLKDRVVYIVALFFGLGDSPLCCFAGLPKHTAAPQLHLAPVHMQPIFVTVRLMLHTSVMLKKCMLCMAKTPDQTIPHGIFIVF